MRAWTAFSRRICEITSPDAKELMALALIGITAFDGTALSASLGILVPVRNGDQIETKPDPDSGTAVPVLRRRPMTRFSAP